MGITRRSLTIEGDGSELPVEVVWAQSTRDPLLVLLHEKRGIDTHTRQVAERLAGDGFTVLIPDLLARLGGSARSASGMGAGARGVPPQWVLDDLISVVDTMVQLLAHDRFGVLGYSFGGELAWRLAAGDARCAVLVDYHGRPRQVDPSAISQTDALVVLAGDDDADKLPEVRVALEAARRSHVELVPGVGRGFEDAGQPEHYRPDAAEQVWEQVRLWLRRALTEPS